MYAEGKDHIKSCEATIDVVLELSIHYLHPHTPSVVSHMLSAQKTSAWITTTQQFGAGSAARS